MHPTKVLTCNITMDIPSIMDVLDHSHFPVKCLVDIFIFRDCIANCLANWLQSKKS